MHSFSRSSSQVGCIPLKRREHIKRAMGHRKEEIQSAQMRRPMEDGEEDPRRRAVFAQQSAGKDQRSKLDRQVGCCYQQDY